MLLNINSLLTHCIQTDLRIIFLPMSRSPPVVKEYIFFPEFDPSKSTSSLFPFLITSLCEMDIIIIIERTSFIHLRAATTGVITVWSRQLRNRGRLNLIQTERKRLNISLSDDDRCPGLACIPFPLNDCPRI